MILGVNLFFVVETEDDMLIGMIEFVEGGIVVRNGFAGHPKFVEGPDIVGLTSADSFLDDEASLVEIDYIKAG